MFAQIEAFHRPSSLEEAVRLLQNPDQKAIPVAGATEVGLRIRGSIKALVDLSGLGLDRIWQDDDGLHLGAMVRTTRICRDPEVRAFCGDALPESAFAIASEPIRNLTTVGGNVVHVTSWSDTPPAFQVLGARFRVQGTRDEIISTEDFFAGPPKRLLKAGDLVTEIIVPRPAPSTGSAFLKHAKTAVDFALVNAAALVTMHGDTVADVRISVGAIHTPPIRLPEAEAVLRGQAATEERLAELSRVAAGEVRPVKDARASERYLRHAAGVLARRAVRLSIDRSAQGGE